MWLKAVPVGCRSFLNNKEGVKSEHTLAWLENMCMEVLGTRLYFCKSYVFLYQWYLFLKLLKGRQGFGQLSKYLTMSYKNLVCAGRG